MEDDITSTRPPSPTDSGRTPRTGDTDGDSPRTAVQSPSGVQQALDVDSVPQLSPVAGYGSDPELSPDDAPPGYTIVKTLGRGGMGVVYLAKQVGLNRLVAVKMILGGAHAGTSAVVRFRIEAEAIARVRHPNIVQVYDIGEHRGMPFFSLEFCTGGALNQMLKDSVLKPREAAAVVAAVAAGVAAAHAAGVIHRDLKPHNVLLDAAGIPKVTDFGLAKRVDSDSDLTATGAVLGTPSYMAPEQARGEAVGPLGDVWALGAILYECLTGRPPFKAATPFDTMYAVIDEEPVPPRQLVPNVPRDLETISLKCLQKDPARRYPSADAMVDDLNRFLDRQPILARPVSRVERAVKWVRRNPAAAAIAGLVAVLFLVVAGSVVAMADTRAKQAQADLKLAQSDADQKTREVEELKRQERVRTAFSRQTTEGRSDKAGGRWTDARAAFTRAISTFDENPGLIDPAEGQAARAELAEVAAALAREAGREQARTDLAEVHKLRDQAYELRLAHALYPFEGGAAARAAETARRALALRPAADLLDVTRTPEEKADLQTDLHELTLTAVGRPLAAVVGGPAFAPRATTAEGPSLLFARGLAGFERNDPAAATAVERQIQLQQSHQVGRILLAAFRLRADKPVDARNELTVRLSQAGDSRLALALRGLASAAVGEATKSEEDFALALDPAADPAVRLFAQTERGLARADRGDWATAEADLREVVTTGHPDPRSHRALARVLFHQGRAKDADAVLTAAIERLPDAPGPRLDRGRLRWSDPAAARADFLAAAKPGSDPVAGEATLELARMDWDAAHAQQATDQPAADRGKAAVEAAAARLAASPAPPPGVFLFLAQVRADLKRYTDAEKAIDRHLQLAGPRAAWSEYALRGWLVSERKRWVDAASAYTAALDRAPAAEQRSLRLARARVYMLSRGYAAAGEDFDLLLKADPADPDALLGQAEVRVINRDLKAGLAAVQAVEEGPNLTQQRAWLAAHVRALVYRDVSTVQPHARQQGYTQEAAGPLFKALTASLRKAIEGLPPGRPREEFWTNVVAEDTAFKNLLTLDAIVQLEQMAKAR